MQDESRKRAEQLRRERGINLQPRVGVNTGEVVLRSIRKDDLHTDYVPVGQSTNLDSWMESLATPGSILVSEQTYKLTEGVTLQIGSFPVCWLDLQSARGGSRW